MLKYFDALDGVDTEIGVEFHTRLDISTVAGFIGNRRAGRFVVCRCVNSCGSWRGLTGVAAAGATIQVVNVCRASAGQDHRRRLLVRLARSWMLKVFRRA